MPLVGSFIFPHGALALSKEAPNVPVAAHKVHDACMEASKKIKELKPDLILLTTPHGVALNEAYVIYNNAKAAGSAEWAGEWTEYKCEVEIAQEESRDLCKYLSDNNKSAKFEMVTSFAESETIALRWGEVIPIWFIQKHCNVESGNAPDYMFFSMPRKRMDNAVEMIPELFTIGKQLNDYFSKLAERVVIVISGDLAHTHPHQEPNHPNPFGINEDAALMDSTLENWVKTQEKELLHIEATKYIATYVCGFTGFVALSGVIADGDDDVTKKSSAKKKWESSLLCREHPTYYGMLVAVFVPVIPPEITNAKKRVKPPKPPHPIIG